MTEAIAQTAWRPVQFLGNKLRVLDAVSGAVADELSDGSTVWDAFSGSSVVSQRIAARGARVVATDKLNCSVMFARAMLSIDRSSSSGVAELRTLSAAEPEVEHAPWSDYIRAEDDAIARRSAEDLSEIGRRLPLRWRQARATSELAGMFGRVDAAAEAGASYSLVNALSTYAGTYFGVRQARDLDIIANGILNGAARGEIDAWERDAGLTALASAASSAVFSAGKHFAQPINVNGELSKFQAGRLLVDRAVSVRDGYLRALDAIEASVAASTGHIAFEAEAENVTTDYLTSVGVSTVYADPPYTAQQYSRFYHLLDTLISGVPARLQRSGGMVTKGLYPEGRYKSAFCSRRHAPHAFEQLAQHSFDASARLVISYSVSAPASTGNSRSIGLEQLLGILERVYGMHRVGVQQIDVRYRQFNRVGSAIAGREDPEVLIVAEAK
jgi:adenine-specific DNA methylase